MIQLSHSSRRVSVFSLLSQMKPGLVVVILAGVVVIYLLLRKKKTPVTPPPPPPPPQCNAEGQGCSPCCLDTLQCINGKCLAANLHDALPAFFLTSGGSNFGMPSGDTIIGTISEPAQWISGQTPSQFWYWDGLSQLAVRAPIVNSQGAIVSMQNNYITAPPRGAVSPFLQTTTTPPDKNGVILTTEGTIYNSDYSMYVIVDSTGKLKWTAQLGVAPKFSLITPTQCSTDSCTSASGCCPPYQGCTAGKCNPCFGDPEKACPDPSTEAVCDLTSSVYKCVSKCAAISAPPACTDAQEAKCLESGDSYAWKCEWKCPTTHVPACGSTNVPVCTETKGEWDWSCPVNPCDLSPPVFNPATTPLAGYTWVSDATHGGRYQNLSVPGSPWKIPNWNCQTQTWSFTSGCDLTYYQDCSEQPGTKAVCDTDTGSNWICGNSQEFQDLCGLDGTKPTCPDRQCLDLSTCSATKKTPSPTDWRWVCPSSEGTTRCEIVKIYDWSYPPLSVPGASDGIVTTTGGIPVYPTVLNEKCRGTATEMNHPDARHLIGNPPVLLMGDGQPGDEFFLCDPSQPLATCTRGSETKQYVITKHTVGENGIDSVPCATPNPCQFGTFVNMDGTPYTAPIEILSPGLVTPPSEAELLSHGKCQCDDKHAGDKCQFDSGLCGSFGTVESCNTTGGKCDPVKGYWCKCQAGYAGDKCQFTRTDCSGHGNPVDDAATLQCVCDTGYAGETCQYSRASCSGRGVPNPTSQSLKCQCDFNSTGAACDQCSASGGLKSVRDQQVVSIQAYGFSSLMYFSSVSLEHFPQVKYSLDNWSQSNALSNGSNADNFTVHLNGSGFDLVLAGAAKAFNMSNMTLDSCGFLMQGGNYLRVTPYTLTADLNKGGFVNLQPVPLTTLVTQGFSGCLFLTLPDRSPALTNGLAAYIRGVNYPNSSLGLTGGALVLTDSLTGGPWNFQGGTNDDGSLQPGPITDPNGNPLIVSGRQPVASGRTLTLGTSSDTPLMFMWDQKGGPIISADVPSLGISFGSAGSRDIPTFVSLGSADSLYAVLA